MFILAFNAGAATQDHVTIALTPTWQEQAKQISLLLPESPSLIIKYYSSFSKLVRPDFSNNLRIGA